MPQVFFRDDVLREGISKICYVYVDDFIIFSKIKEDHVKDIQWVLVKLLEAGMRVSQKSKFLKKKTSSTWDSSCRKGITEPHLKR